MLIAGFVDQLREAAAMTAACLCCGRHDLDRQTKVIDGLMAAAGVSQCHIYLL